MENDSCSPETNGHTPCLQRLLLQLQSFLVDQLDACIDHRRVVDGVNRYGRMGEHGGAFHIFQNLRISDRR